MPITVTCDCGRRLKAKDEAAGRTAKCPACGNPVTFPALEPTPVGDDPFVNSNWSSPEEVHPPTQPPTSGNNRFLAIVVTLALVFLGGGIFLINRVNSARQRREASEQLHQSLTEAIQAANSSVLKGDFAKAADVIRPIMQPRPSVEKDDQNEGLLSEAEALMKASEIAANGPKLIQYLDHQDDASPNRIRQGDLALSSPISDAKVKKVIDSKFAMPVTAIQSKREQLARRKMDEQLAADPVHQKNQFIAWADDVIGNIMQRDSDLRLEVWSMEKDFKSKLFQPLTRRGIENVLDEWGDIREKMLEARTIEIGDATESFTRTAMKHPVWRVGTMEDQTWMSENFGSKLRNLVMVIDKPVETQLASLEATFGDKLQRGMRQLNDLNTKMRDTTRYYEDSFNGRIKMPPR